jgi:hypothetical protein
MGSSFEKADRPINKLQILIGITVLLIGTLVYLIDRPPEHTYFVYRYFHALSFYHIIPNLFGSLVGGSLPEFTHVFSFILITAGIISCGKRGYLIISSGWLFIDCGFKLGQKFSSLSVKIIPDWFSNIPVLEATKGYFLKGTWDIKDIIAIFFGASAAYLVLITTMKRRDVYE